MLEPIGAHILVHLEPEQSHGAIWTPPQAELAKPATVLRSGDTTFQPGDRVIIALRLAVQVGDDLLLPTAGILARLD